MAGPGLFQKVVRGLSRDKDLALNLRVKRGYTLLSQSAVAKVALRAVAAAPRARLVAAQARAATAARKPPRAAVAPRPPRAMAP